MQPYGSLTATLLARRRGQGRLFDSLNGSVTSAHEHRYMYLLLYTACYGASYREVKNISKWGKSKAKRNIDNECGKDQETENISIPRGDLEKEGSEK